MELTNEEKRKLIALLKETARLMESELAKWTQPARGGGDSLKRTEQQQRETIERLLRLWTKHPELRLAQLVLGGFRTDIYYLEDVELIESLEQSYRAAEEATA